MTVTMLVRGGAVILAALLAYVARIVAQHSIAVVEARRLLPRWDLATHLESGWFDYHMLVTGQIHRLLWDLWLQGYWPPMLSVYQVPFYAALGGTMSAGLWSSLCAFVFTGTIGCAVLWRQWGDDALLPAAVFIALLISSPYLLAYASVSMTETFGALVQLVVLLAYVHYRQHHDAPAARLFAISLTVLFFTKYNYFFLLVAPLLLQEWLERTSGGRVGPRLSVLASAVRCVLSSPTGALLTAYVVAVVIIQQTGGFEFHLFGRRVSVHTIGNSGHVVLYLLLLRLWYQHHRGRIDWARLTATDVRIRPLLLWFALPVTIWFASPYPNHIRDLANLVVNRPLGESTLAGGLVTYVDALRSEYFFSGWMLAAALTASVIAALRYARQPPLLQWLIIAIPLQLAVIALHQTRFPRFLLLTVVLLCLLAASETGRWVAAVRGGRVVAGLLAPIVLVACVAAARTAVRQPRFQAVAFENYTDDDTLRAAFDGIRAELSAEDRVALVGQGNELSPALLRWELGPPSGVPCYPFQIGGARGVPLALATRVLLMEPLGDEPTALDLTGFYMAQRRAVLAQVDDGQLALRREIPLAGRHVVMRIYDRRVRPAREAPCQ